MDCRSRVIELIFVVASVRIEPPFHFSTFTAPAACSSALSAGCSNVEGFTAVFGAAFCAGAGDALWLGVPPGCWANPGTESIVNRTVVAVIRIGMIFPAVSRT